ncbi:DNA polymerase III subunit alpha [Patescibacteria group bacterium]|nr:DNA polymerase III subunit alpha [Patescibacteria group bacterium]
MKSSDFVHLHVHTEYSLLDGLPKIKSLTSKTKELAMNSLAITDHGAMYGAIEFYKACKKEGLKPIIGCEIYLAAGNRKDKTAENRQNYHLLLLAKNHQGYRNLIKIVSIGHLEGFYYKPRIDWEIMEKYHQDLICTSACVEGEIAQQILEDNYQTAKQRAADYRQLFGKDYYLEIQNHPGLKKQDAVNTGLVKISRELGIPLVATNDVHYLDKEDSFAQDVLLMINTQTTVNTPKRLSMLETPDFYLKSPEEMEKEFRDFPDAIENTKKIADKCEIEIELGKWYFPKFPIPKGETNENLLRKKTFRAAKDHYGKPLSKEVKERLKYELEIICGKGYAPYFLIMKDFIDWTEKNNTRTNTRGSAAGSLASFVLGITSVDPLIYNLPFERFLNKQRPSPPDIDLDVSDDKRQQMLYHIVDQYGEEAVAQICTFGRMLARGSVRDTARVLGYEYAVGDKIAKLIPIGSQGFPMSIDKALKISPELKALYDQDQDCRKVIDAAKQIEGCARHISVHACALVISPTTINEFSPTQKEAGGDKIITQYEMHAIEDVGLIKLDILGIRNLSILSNALVNLKKTKKIKVNLRKISLDDKKTFKMLANGDTMGVFQFSGKGITSWLKELKPNQIEDLMAMVALYRPGPMAIIPEYIARKRNPDRVSYLDPRMKEFLDKSYGLIVYQDDCLYTAIYIAGYDWVKADKFRKAIGKKIPEEMEEQKQEFIDGCVANGLNKKKAEELFASIESFVGFGFNKAHAASYGMLAYHTAYMKANYPVEYMCALLTAESEDVDKISAGVKECRKMGIIVYPPEINKSGKDFKIKQDKDSLDGMAIWFGLNAIKNVGAAAIEEILKARKSGGDFTSLTDFCLRVNGQKVNKKVLESLVKAGALDIFGKRSAILASLDKIREKTSKKQKDLESGQTSFFSFSPGKEKETINDELTEVEEFPKEQLLRMEKELLGLYLTEHPLVKKLAALSNLVTHKINELEEVQRGRVKIAGSVSKVRTIFTRNGNKEMCFVSIEDDTGQVELVVFPGTFSETKELLIEEKLVLIEAKIEFREDKQSLIAEKIADGERVPPGSQKTEEGFIIDIPKGTGSQILIRLNSLLKANPGSDTGLIRFPNGKEVTVSFGIGWNIDLEQEIKSLLKLSELKTR